MSQQSNGTTVFVVTRGEYSDYNVVSVCSTLQNAEMLAASELADSFFTVELDTLVDKIKDGYRGIARVHMLRDGTVIKIEWQYDAIQDLEYSYVYDERKAFIFVQWAKDEDHAIKVANEKRTAMVISGQWPDNH